jgi:pimeloyl-ACP methyl ester carboxylesterase
MRRALLTLATLLISSRSLAAESVYGPMLEGFDYPHPVQRFEIGTQGQALSMAYMDVRPKTPNGFTVVLLHGKNFCAATWEQTIRELSDHGWRVVAPDQIGFCKSSKPERYQFTLHQLAFNTNALLKKLGIRRAVIAGHSMGGMLAARYALLYANSTQALFLINPIGLENWESEGVPYRTVDQWLAAEQRTTADTIREYQRTTYYAGSWKPAYDRWVIMQAGMYAGPGREQVLWNQALTSDMIFTQPVVHEFSRIVVPTVLFIGEKDTTAIGKAAAPPQVQARIGKYAELGPRTVKVIPDARLVTFSDLGHSPHIQAPQRFHQALLQELQRVAGPQ